MRVKVSMPHFKALVLPAMFLLSCKKRAVLLSPHHSGSVLLEHQHAAGGVSTIILYI